MGLKSFKDREAVHSLEHLVNDMQKFAFYCKLFFRSYEGEAVMAVEISGIQVRVKNTYTVSSNN